MFSAIRRRYRKQIFCCIILALSCCISMDACTAVLGHHMPPHGYHAVSKEVACPHSFVWKDLQCDWSSITSQALGCRYQLHNQVPEPGRRPRPHLHRWLCSGDARRYAGIHRSKIILVPLSDIVQAWTVPMAALKPSGVWLVLMQLEHTFVVPSCVPT